MMKTITASSSVVAAFLGYGKHYAEKLARLEEVASMSPTQQQQLLANYLESLKSLAVCAQHNQEVLADMVSHVTVDVVVNGASAAASGHRSLTVSSFAAGDFTDAEGVIRQLVRDWSAEGAKARKSCYGPIMEELEKLYPVEFNRETVKVLVPGAGLCRLAAEVAALGFDCRANECSQFMLLASQFVMSHNSSSFKVFPWIHQLTNNLSIADATESVTCPDVDPADLLAGKKFTMVPGDFLAVFDNPGHESSVDCVVTCFFLDCAKNVLEFIELIHRVLKPGGHWINFGPLAYCYKGEVALQPSYDVLKIMIEDVGFKFEKEETSVRAEYNQRPSSMINYYYQCVFFSCTK